MNWKIIIEKMIKGSPVIKEGIIKIRLSSIETVLKNFKNHGWLCTYAVPVTELEFDEDSVYIETGVK